MDEGSFHPRLHHARRKLSRRPPTVLDEVEKILRSMPEVSITTRRTGLQLGLAAVTEANTGDITVRLKTKRSRSIDEIIADVRQQIKERSLSSMLNSRRSRGHDRRSVELSRTNPDQALLERCLAAARSRPKVQAAIADSRHRRHAERRRQYPQRSSTTFQVEPALASRLGFTPQEVAEDATSMLDGLPTTDPSHRQRPALHGACAYVARNIALRWAPSRTPSSTLLPATLPPWAP